MQSTSRKDVIPNYASLYYKGEYEQSLKEIEKEEISGNLEALIYKSLILLNIQDYENAYKEAAGVFEISINLSNKIAELAARYVKSRALISMGKLEEGLKVLNIDESKYYNPNYSEYDKKKLFQWLGYVKYGQGYGLWRSNNLTDALNTYFDGLQIAKSIDYRPLIADFFNNIGIVYDLQGDLNKALKYYNQGLELKIDLENHRGIFFIRNNIGILLTKKGDLEPALVNFNTNLEFLSNNKSATKSMWRVTYANLSKIYYIQNDYENAIKYNTEALEIAKLIEDKPALAYDLFKSILIYLDMGLNENAKQNLEILNEIREKTDDPNIEIDYRISNGLINKSGKRINNLGIALEIFEDLAKQKIELFETKIFILYELVELLIINYQLLPSPEIVDQANSILSEIIKLSEHQNTYPIIIETLIVKAKLNQVLGNFTLSHNLLENALDMARSRNLTIYVKKIQNEISNIGNIFDKWSKSKLTTKTKIEEISIIDYLNSLSRIIK